MGGKDQTGSIFKKRLEVLGTVEGKQPNITTSLRLAALWPLPLNFLS